VTDFIEQDIGASLVVVDYETTGLDPLTGQPLELAMILVNDDLDVLDERTEVIKPERAIHWDTLHPDVRTMHEQSGLREALDRGEGRRKKAVETNFREWLAKNGAEKLPMCGSNVANFDRPWMRAHMPELEAVFHYRNVDVSTIKECCRRWNPRVFEYAPKKRELHRALADCNETITELGYYLDEFFMVDFGADDDDDS
jgi:oligoribonuclease